MPPSTTTADAASSVQISFYDAEGKLNPDFGGQLHDLRDSISISLTGDSSKVLSAQAFLDSADATSTASLKSYPLQIGRAKNTIVETDEAFAGMTGTYDFEPNTSYVVKLKITSNTSPYNAFYARFSIGGAAATPSYSFLYRTTFDTISATVENVDDIQTGLPIKIAAPMVFSSDARRPKDMIFTFDVYESLEDTDNSEALSSYTVTQEYKGSGEYELEDNQLQNDNKYALTVTAVYADGYSISANVAIPVYSVAKPVINQTTSQAYGLGPDSTDAGDLATSTVAVVYLEPSSMPENILLYDNKVTFDFKQGLNLCYSIEMDADSATNKYTIYSDDPKFTKRYPDSSPPLPNPNTTGTYTFSVYAKVNYVKDGTDYFTKTSTAWTSDKYTQDIVPLTNVVIGNTWVNASVTTVNNKRIVKNDDTLSVSGYNQAQKLGISGKFSKTNFYGTGKTGMLKDLDTTNTQYTFQLSVNGGIKFDVPKLALMQGKTTLGVKDSDQQNYVSLLDVVPITTQGGKVDNIPFSTPHTPPSQTETVVAIPTVVPGSDQPDMFFLIPNNNNSLFQQSDKVEVIVSITSKTNGITLPPGTKSNSITMVNKVSEYSMTLGSASEPSMTGSGANTKLTVPIDVSTNIETGDYYLSSATFYSTLAAPNDDVTVAQSNSGKFNIVLTNVSPVDANCEYHVAYNIDHPELGIIEGPSLATYAVPLSDEPRASDNVEVTNLLVTNYAYTTFADPTGLKVAGFSFDIKFKDVTKDGRRSSPDGAHVYFKNSDGVSTLVKTIARSDGDTQTDINGVLQSTSPTSLQTSILVNNVTWNNWTSAIIMIKAFKTPKVSSTNDEEIDSVDSVDNTIFNIPPIPAPTNFKLSGGVQNLWSANATGARVNPTSAQWDDTLSAYGTVVTSSYVLTYSNSVNTTTPVDKSGQIVEPSSGINAYFIDVETLAAGTEYILTLLIKLVGANGYTWEGIPQIMNFNSLQVDQSAWNVTVNRGSSVGPGAGDANTLVAYMESTYPAGLNITERKLCDNTAANSNNPYNTGVYTLNNIGKDTLQHIGPTIFNTYNLLDQTPSYGRGAKLTLQVRTKVGVSYTLQTGSETAVTKQSLTWYLALDSPVTTYTTAGRPQLTIADGYTVQNNNIVVNFKVDAVGLESQGLSGVTAVVAQDSDLTDPNDPMFGNGGSMMVAFGPDANHNSILEGISSINGVTTYLNTVDMDKVKAGSLLAATVIPGLSGLNIKNGAATNNVVPKINYYYYTNRAAAYKPATGTTLAVDGEQNSNNSFTLSNLTGLGLYAVFYNNGGTQLPFIIAYTSPVAAGNRRSWYSSNVFYAPTGGGVWPLTKGLTLAYSGTDDLKLFPEIPTTRRYQYAVNVGASLLNTTNGDTAYLSEYVNSLTLQTSSNAGSTAPGSFDFRLLETGAVTSHTAFNRLSLKYHVVRKSYIDGILSVNDVVTNLSSLDKVEGDSTIVATFSDNVNGLNIKNGAAVAGVVPSISYLFYDNINSSKYAGNSFTLNQSKGLGVYAVFYNNVGCKQNPYFIVYTNGGSASSGSNIFLAPYSGGLSPIEPGLTLAFSGTDDGRQFPEIPSTRRFGYKINTGLSVFSNSNNTYMSEFVTQLTINTSSNGGSTNTGDFDFRLLETGMETSHPAFNTLWLKYHVNIPPNSYLSNTTVYGDGVDANANDALDNLAANESRKTSPENLSDIFGAIETSVCTLDLGSLTSTDASKLTFSSDGFDTTRELVVVMTASSARGTSVSVKTLAKQ